MTAERADPSRDHVELHAGPDAAAISDRGQRHARNEDAVGLAATTEGEVVAVVCDGVSTTPGSELAAGAAVAAAMDTLHASAGEPAAPRLQAAYASARDAVARLGDTDGPGSGPPSCTFLAAVLRGTQAAIASLGDCRAAWLPDEGPAQWLTVDDSWAGAQVTAGLMEPAEAFSDPRAHTITRWIGGDADPQWEPPCTFATLGGSGRLVLCSDGLWNYAPEAAGVAAAAGAGDAATMTRRLVDFATGAGGEDDITVVVLAVPAGPA